MYEINTDYTQLVLIFGYYDANDPANDNEVVEIGDKTLGQLMDIVADSGCLDYYFE